MNRHLCVGIAALAGLFGWTAGPALEEVLRYLESVKKHPNPPAPNITQFTQHGG